MRTKLLIASLGWYNHGNTGDEAFKVALQKLLPTAEFSFVNNIPANQEIINNSDHLLIGGGNIVDAGFLRGLGLIRVPYSFIGVGLVPGMDFVPLATAANVIVRDSQSLGLAQQLRSDVILAPDLTFILAPDRKRGEHILRSCNNLDPDRQTVGVFLNDCVSASFESSILKFVECEKVKLELARFLEKIPYNIVFIPMSVVPPNDLRISLDVIGKMKKGHRYPYLLGLEPLEYLDVISALDLAITMRLHADIFCTIAGVPFIDVVHHDKNKGYLWDIGMEELSLDYYELSIRTLEEKFAMVTENREEISRRLFDVAAKNKRDLEELIKNVHLPQERADTIS